MDHTNARLVENLFVGVVGVPLALAGIGGWYFRTERTSE